MCAVDASLCSHLAVWLSQKCCCVETVAVFTLSTFSSVIDIIVGLGNDGYVSGFMTNYLIYGEPYLATPYGTVICYWDGIVHFALYLYMLTAMACRLVINRSLTF